MATVKNLAELKAVGELKQGDKVVFAVKGKELNYTIGEKFLRRDGNHIFNGRDVFENLGMGERESLAFARGAFGYSNSSSDDNIMPEYCAGDYAAATRLVEALYIEIARQEMGAQAPSPAAETPSKRVPGKPALISSAADLDTNLPLQEGDKIFFETREGEVTLGVRHDGDGWYCGADCSMPYGKGIVFNRLGYDSIPKKKSFAREAVGREPNNSYRDWPQYKDAADFAKLVRALLVKCGQGGEAAPAKPVEPTGPRTITTVEELRAALPLKGGDGKGDLVYIAGHTEYHVFKDEDGWQCILHSEEFSDAAFRDLGIDSPRAHVESLVGYTPSSHRWPAVRTAEDLAKVIEDLMIRAGQKAPFTRTPGKPVHVTTVEELEAVAPLQVGDEFVVPAGGENITCYVRKFFMTGQFFISNVGEEADGQVYRKLGLRPGSFIAEVIGKTPRDPQHDSPDVPTLEDMTKLAKALMTHEARAKQPEPTEPAAPEYAEGDVMRSEDGWYQRILAVSSDGKVFALSSWTSDKDDEETLSDPGEAVSLEDLVDEFTVVKPATPVTLTKAQIAEKFGIDVALLRIEDAA